MPCRGLRTPTPCQGLRTPSLGSLAVTETVSLYPPLHPPTHDPAPVGQPGGDTAGSRPHSTTVTSPGPILTPHRSPGRSAWLQQPLCQGGGEQHQPLPHWARSSPESPRKGLWAQPHRASLHVTQR